MAATLFTSRLTYLSLAAVAPSTRLGLRPMAPLMSAGRAFCSAASAVRLPVNLLSEEEQAIKDMAADFSAREIASRVSEMDEKATMDPQLLKELFQAGLFGIEIPEQYGGSGMSFTQSCLAIQETAKVDPAVSVTIDIQNTLINTIMMKWATEEQKQLYLPLFATEMICSFALSEAGSGSDAFAMKTVAKQDGDHWRINGTKMWISSAKEAGMFLVFANANPSAGYKGITAFLVPKDTPGLTVGKKEDKLGIRASSTCEVLLEDVRVPAANMIGPFGQGYKIAISALNEGRIGIAAQMVGLAQGVFDHAVRYAHERHQFGRPVASNQGMQVQIAEVAMEIECAELLMLNAARMKDHGGLNFIQAAAMAKLKASQVAEFAASRGVEWMGGVGFTKEFPVEKFYRDAKIGAIYEGTSLLQAVTIAKQLSAKYM